MNYDPVDEIVQISRWLREGEALADRRVRSRQLGTAFGPQTGQRVEIPVKTDGGLRRSA